VSTVLLILAGTGMGWKDALEGSGIDVLSARRLTDGVKRLREGGIDLVVIEAEGDPKPVEDFVSELERLPDPPPFLLTSSRPSAPELSAHLGAVGFLPKPCTPSELADAVHRVIPGTVVSTMDDIPTSPRTKKLFPNL